MTLQPYPAYKESGVPWMGDVPEHWQVKRFKLFIREIDDRSENGKEELLTVSQYTGVTRRSARRGGENQLLSTAASLVGYKRVKADELAMNIMLAWNGSLGVSPLDGIISPAYCVFRVDENVRPWFLHYLLRTPLFTGIFKTVSTGVVDSRLRLYPDIFLRLPGLLPPIAEQQQIVRFLDHADQRIRRYISAKKKLITLLNEQKQAIVNRAVTRGLDPNARLKPTGVEWLGGVPEQWEIWQVGHFAHVGNGSTPSRGNAAYWNNGTYPWLNSSSVNHSPISSTGQFVTDTALRECHLPRVQPGSVLMAITGQGKTRGTAAVLTVEATINQHIAYITPRRDKVSPEYLQLSFVAAYRQLRMISDDSGSTKGALTCSDISHFKVPLPPPDEQDRIVSVIRQDTQAVETAKVRTEREIDLLREYRTRLIADVVTGKLDVRDAARSLPDETDEPEPLHNAEALTEIDVDDDLEQALVAEPEE